MVKASLDPNRLRALPENARAILLARSQAGVTQEELSRYLGYSMPAVSNAEHSRGTDEKRDKYLGAIAALVGEREAAR